MRNTVLVLIIYLLGQTTVFCGPAPYGSSKIYICNSQNPPSADFIRKEADIIISIESNTVDFYGSLHWENAKLDPSVKQTAKPIVMIIDLYNRVQPEPPAKPIFDTLYCTKKIAYSEDGQYINISALFGPKFVFPLYP